MSTLKKIVYDLVESIHTYTTDSNYSLEYLAYQVNNTRALLLQQKASNRSYIIPNKLRQHFYADLELSEGNEIVSGLGTILRTKNPIAYPMEPFNLKSNLRITSGSYTDISFSFVNSERFPFIGQNKWLQNQIYCCIGSDFRLYFTSSNPAVKLLEKVKLSYVAENPEEAYPLTIDYDSNVSFWDTEYPCEDNMITQISDIIVKKLTQMLQIPEDKLNDATDDLS